MATIHYEGLDGWWKSAAFWGMVGTIVGIRVGLPIPWETGAIVAGAATGAVQAFWLAKVKLRWSNHAGWAIPLVLVAALYFVVVSGHGPGTTTGGYLALGALMHATQQIAFGVLGARAMKVLNAKNAGWLSRIDPAPKRLGPPVPEAPAVDLESCRTRLLGALPEPLRGEIATAFQTVTRATPFRSLESIPPAASSLSGAAQLDPSFEWPARDGRPLDFLAQLNLGEIPDTGHARPPQGLLSIFHDTENQPWGDLPDDLSGTVVLFTPDPALARPLLKPGTPPHAPPRKPLAFSQTGAFCLNRDQEERLDEFIQQADDVSAEVVSDMKMTLEEANPSDGHRVLSAPSVIQNDMDDDLASAAGFLGLPPGTPWTLLLQLDSDSDLGWCWGDAGCLYFWIPAADLAEGRFDRVWTILQCC